MKKAIQKMLCLLLACAMMFGLTSKLNNYQGDVESCNYWDDVVEEILD